MSSPNVPQGFQLAVASAGFKKPGRKDLAFVLSDRPAVAAGVFTRNVFKAAPVQLGSEILQERATVRAAIFNAGNANACTGAEGFANCCLSQEYLAAVSDIEPGDILPASTGVIGQQFDMALWQKAIPELMDNLGKASVEDFAQAIMTTDAFPKFCGEELLLSGGSVTLAAVAKGAGMICPNMATMLSLVLCDADVDAADWRAMFSRVVDRTFNRATVDGDTSTNDTLYGLANGASGVKVEGDDLKILENTLTGILEDLAYKLVQDGEGASKVMHIHVRGTASDADAETVARTVGHSPLVKTAMYGKDANWGRIIAAVGRSGVACNASDVRLSLCGVEVFVHEQPVDKDLDALLKEPLEDRDIAIDITVGAGPGEYRLLASDLGHEYVSINADYRT